MRSTLEKDSENSDLAILGKFDIDKWSLLASSIRNMLANHGPLKNYQHEFKDAHREFSPDRPLQAAILEDVSSKLYECIIGSLESKRPLQSELFLIFIGILITTNIMTKADEEFISGWVKKGSKLKMICESMLEKVKLLFGQTYFLNLKMQSIEYLVKHKDTIFNENYKNEMNKKIEALKFNHELTWNKILNTISTLSFELQQEGGNENQILTSSSIENIQNKKYTHNDGKNIPLQLQRDIESILATLSNLQGNHITDRERYKKIIEIQPVVELLCQRLRYLILTDEVFSKEDKNIIKCIFRINLELIKCYHVVINWAINAFFLKKKPLLTALQACIHCYSKILYYTYEQHAHVLQGVWSGLNNCYLIALTQKVDKIRLKKPGNWHNQLNTLEEMYKYCLLLSLVNPYQLHLREIKLLNYAIEFWAPLVELKNKTDAEPAFLTIDLHADAPPELIQNEKKYSQDTYNIKLIKIIERIQSLLINDNNKNHAKFNFTESEQTLSKNILDIILTNWNTKEIATHLKKNHDALSPVRVCLGISSSFYLINHATSPTKEPECNNESDALSTTNHSDIENIDAISVEQVSINNKFKRSNEKKIYQCYVCEIVDKRDNKYILGWNKEIPAELRCGEIIAIEIHNANHEIKWELGAISAIKNEHESTQVIVNILSDDVVAVNGYYTNGAIMVTKPLLISMSSHGHSHTSIFAPALSFKNGQEISISLKKKMYLISLSETIHSSNFYTQFEIEGFSPLGCKSN